MRGASSSTARQLSTLQSNVRSGLRSTRSRQSPQSSPSRPRRYSRSFSTYAGRHCGSPMLFMFRVTPSTPSSSKIAASMRMTSASTAGSAEPMASAPIW